MNLSAYARKLLTNPFHFGILPRMRGGDVEVYCSVCGRKGHKSGLRLLTTMPDGEPSYVCRDEKACDRRFRGNLKRLRKTLKERQEA